MSRFLERVERQGLRCTLRKGLEKIVYYWNIVVRKILNDTWDRVLYHLPSFLPDYREPNAEELKEIEAAFDRAGVKIRDYNIDISQFLRFTKDFDFGANFYGGHNNPVWVEKMLEHYIAYDMLLQGKEGSGELYLDVAANHSPWAKLLLAKGYRAIAIDLVIPPRFVAEPNYMAMDATATTFPDQSVSCASLHCAFEMFAGDDDTELVRELSRILVRGGRALIVPLYMHTHYCGYTTREFRFRTERHAPGARLYLRRDMSAIPFSRKYDVGKLRERVLLPAADHGLKCQVHVLRNGKEVSEHVYCHFILELVKK